MPKNPEKSEPRIEEKKPQEEREEIKTPERKEIVKEKGEELSPEEILDIMHIVDIGPKHLEKITLDNAREIIEEGIQQLKENKKRQIAFSPAHSPSEGFKALSERSSMSHKIVCSVNGAEDFKAFKKQFDYSSSKKGINKENPNFKYITAFLNRHINMKELLTQLYTIDMMRRIGSAKNEEAFFKGEMPNLEKLIKPIEKSLDNFEVANKEDIEDENVNSRFKIKDKVNEFKKILHEENYEDLKKDFYDKICQKYSELIFIDFEGLNEKELKKAVENLEK